MAWKAWQREEVAKQRCSRRLPEDTLAFALPIHNEWRLLAEHTHATGWETMMERVNGKLKGTELTDRKYTPYSFRSYRAMELNRVGIDPLLAADQLGHDVSVMQKIYARLPARERATREAAAFTPGEKKIILPKILEWDMDY